MTFEELLLDFIARHYRDAAHSIFSPSGSAMWMTCPGSLIPNVLSHDQAGFDAAEGTVAHSVHEEWLKSGERPVHMMGQVVTIREGSQTFEIEIDKAMMDFVEESVDLLINLPGVHHVEKKVYFSRLTPIPKQGGTADFFVCQPHKLTIRDYKHGKGVMVHAERNSQAMLYALGVFFKWDWLFDFQEFDIGIHQPRLDHFDYWTTDRKSLLKFAKTVRACATDAWRLNAPLSPSEKACRFCAIKATCPAYLKVMDDITDDVFSGVYEVTSDDTKALVDDLRDDVFAPELKPPLMLETGDMSQLIEFRGMFEKWFSAMETELESRALAGQTIPGHKLVEARSTREFIDERKAVRRMAEAGIDWSDLYSVKFTSPAQAEELLRGVGMKKAEATEFLKSVVRKPLGKPVLVPETDRRPPYVAPDEGVFDDLMSDSSDL